jgi:uncharacterized protein (TIGR03086 family)
MSLVDLYRQSVESFVDRVGQTRPDQWHAPTPCTDWDVRTLVNHVVYEMMWSVPLFAGATIAEVGDRFEGDLLGDDPLAVATEAGEDARAAVSEPGAMDRTVHLSFGDTPAEEYVHQLFADYLVHGWDLAVGIGADRTMDPEAVRECVKWFADREEMYRAGGAIGPRVALPDDASDQDRLLAAFGRDPNQKLPS